MNNNYDINDARKKIVDLIPYLEQKDFEKPERYKWWIECLTKMKGYTKNTDIVEMANLLLHFTYEITSVIRYNIEDYLLIIQRGKL